MNLINFDIPVWNFFIQGTMNKSWLAAAASVSYSKYEKYGSSGIDRKLCVPLYKL